MGFEDAWGSWLGFGILILILKWSLVFDILIFRILALYSGFDGAMNTNFVTGFCIWILILILSFLFHTLTLNSSILSYSLSWAYPTTMTPPPPNPTREQFSWPFWSLSTELRRAKLTRVSQIGSKWHVNWVSNFSHHFRAMSTTW